MPTSLENILALIGRWLISLIFVTSAISKVFGWNANVEYMASKHMHAIPLLLGTALLIEALGPICLITGLAARAAAAVMFLYLVPVTFLLHEFMSTNFQKNVGIMGGLLMIVALGPGKFALGSRAPASMR
jgi:putative oxidoreductase